MKILTCCAFFLLAGCGAPPSATEQASDHIVWPEGTVVDLSYAYGDDTIYWPTADTFQKTTDFEGISEGGYYYAAYTVRTAEHGGTHLDAPVHFAEGKLATDELPLARLMGPAVLIDVSSSAASDPDYLVSIADIESWEDRNGSIPDGSIVLLRTGWGKFWPDAAKYLGTAERGAEAIPLLHFPGLDPEAAAWITENRAINAIGIDTPSIDRGQSADFMSHQILFKENIPAFENVAQMNRLPEKGFVIIALPMKIAGGSGGPLRIVAIVPENEN